MKNCVISHTSIGRVAHISFQKTTEKREKTTRMTEKRVVNRVQAVTIMTCHCINIPQVSHKNENKWSLITYLSVWCV